MFCILLKVCTFANEFFAKKKMHNISNLLMTMREEYKAPVVEEFFVVQSMNLMFEMSTELPESVDEGDADTFGPAQPI